MIVSVLKEENINRVRINKLNLVIASVWLVNGLYCKVLNYVPRHEKIVATILGETYARPLTLAIGFGEIALAAWIILGYKARWTALLQIALVLTMNLLEFLLAPHLLLFGRYNIVWAAAFCILIFLLNFTFAVKRSNR